jgi:hypothetical protein
VIILLGLNIGMNRKILRLSNMNEKIKKIAEKAGLVRVGDFGLKRWEGSKSDSISDQDIERLTLMIIEECLILENEINDGMFTKEEIVANEKYIKNSFGINNI